MINSQAIDDRFKHISEVARTRSIISLGLSCFKLKESKDADSPTHLSFNVQTFNLMALCSEDYLVEPSGFDFHKQYSQGIPYYRGNDNNVKVQIPIYLLSYKTTIVFTLGWKV